MEIENEFIKLDCTKVKFSNEKDALYYIDKLKRTSHRSKIPQRAYLCQHCFLWHLTSETKHEECRIEKYKTKIENQTITIKNQQTTIKNLKEKYYSGKKKENAIEILNNRIMYLSKENEALRIKIKKYESNP